MYRKGGGVFETSRIQLQPANSIAPSQRIPFTVPRVFRAPSSRRTMPQPPDPTFTPTLSPVILFKTPSATPSSSDPYALALTPAGFSAHFVPVLQETYESSIVLDILRDGIEKWEGAIVTSKRGMEGWVKGVETFLSLPSSLQRQRHTNKGKEKEQQSDDGKSIGWNSLRLFSVGTSSTDYLESTNIPIEYKPTPVSQSQTFKSATALAELIVRTPPRGPEKEGYKPYLFLCGDKTLEDLPRILREQGRDVEEVRVYRTEGRNDVGDNLEEVQNELEGDRKGGWLGFWSPSSAAIVLPLLRLGSEASNSGVDVEHVQGKTETEVVEDGPSALGMRWEGWKVFAIGETTRRYLEEEGKVKVDAVAEKPNPEGMMEALRTVGGTA
ncbi:hypothetical protein IAR55_006105 [Kwoniella newhampshirensis]|uniref:Tetrapyrrole biosynthesis uroporphyrinogen III synthase domain-containing protein n=1 Tax=Kwoniella newhampshirensis TaxID=1651941 RepID=A0AAW0YTY3_9TREE